MPVLAETSQFVVSPDFGAAVWLLAVLAGCGAATAAKGRWGWLVLGLVTGGLLWLWTAVLLATPDSVWARAFYGATKMNRARDRFPRRLPYAGAPRRRGSA